MWFLVCFIVTALEQKFRVLLPFHDSVHCDSRSPVIPLMEVYNKSLCKPRELLVEIIQEYPEEVEHIFIPSCVVLTRCAGCCNDEMLQCMPTSSYNITMEVSRVICDRVYARALNRRFINLFFAQNVTPEGPHMLLGISPKDLQVPFWAAQYA